MLKISYIYAFAALISLAACTKSEDLVVSSPSSNNPSNGSNNGSTAVAAPIAAFSFPNTTNIAPCDITFANTTVGASTTYLWDFGDGTTSTLQTPRHRFAAAGVYSVRLTARNSIGTHIVTKNLMVTTPAAIYSTCGVLDVKLYQLPSDLLSLSSLSYIATDNAGHDLGFSSAVDPSTVYTPSDLPILINKYGSSFRPTTDLNGDIKIKISFYDNTGNQVFKEIALKPSNYYPTTAGNIYSTAPITLPGGWYIHVLLKWS
jgi:PKD repeat protein